MDMGSLDSDGRSGWRQLHAVLAARLTALVAALEPGERLPTNVELAQRYGVTRDTIASALSRLAVAGVVQRDALGGWQRATTAGSREPLLTPAHVEPWLKLWRAEAGPGTDWMSVLEGICAWLLKRPPGTAMESTRALAARFGVDYTTMRVQVLKRLAAAGLVVNHGGGRHGGWTTADVLPPPFGSVEPETRHWRLAIEPLERICRERMVAGQLLPPRDQLAALLGISAAAASSKLLPELARRRTIERDRHARGFSHPSRPWWRTAGGDPDQPPGDARVRAVVENLAGRVRASSPGALLPSVAQLADEYGMVDAAFAERVLPALAAAAVVEPVDAPAGGWARAAELPGPFERDAAADSSGPPVLPLRPGPDADGARDGSRRLKYAVADRLIARVWALEPGARLPTIADLAQEHGVARGTIRAALAVLLDRGVVERGPWRRAGIRTAGRSALRSEHVAAWRMAWRAEAASGSTWLVVLEAAVEWVLAQPPGTPLAPARVLADRLRIDPQTFRAEVLRRLELAGFVVGREDGSHDGWKTAEASPPASRRPQLPAERPGWVVTADQLADWCATRVGQLLPAHDELAELFDAPAGRFRTNVLPELRRRGVIVREGTGWRIVARRRPAAGEPGGGSQERKEGRTWDRPTS